MRLFGRVLTAMITPFDEDLHVNLAQAGILARKLVECGSDGLIIATTTGESPTLTRKEKIDLYRVVVEAVGGSASVIANTGGQSTRESIELTMESEQTGIDGILLAIPHENKPPQEGLYRHFSAAAKATRLPVLLLNDPAGTSVNIEPDTLARLAEVENITAVAETGGSIARTMAYRERLPGDFFIYSAEDLLALPLMAMGAVGVVSAAAHLVGRRIKEMVEAAASGRLEQATRINNELTPLFRVLAGEPGMVKGALNLLGFKAGGLRSPLIEADAAALDKIRSTLKALGLL